MYLLHGKLEAKAGQEKRLEDILLTAAQSAPTMAGCHLYVVGKKDGEPRSVYITEIWDNKAAHDNSLKNEDTRALIQQAIPLLATQPERGDELKILGGFGI